MRRLLAPLLVCLGLSVATAAPAGATLSYSFPVYGSGYVSARLNSTGVSPPRGRHQTCIVQNPTRSIYRVRSQVYYKVGTVTYATPVISSATYPTVGQCAIADDFEWYYTNRHISGGRSEVDMANGTVAIVYCSLSSCSRTQ